MTNMLRTAIVEDDAIVRHGLAQLIGSAPDLVCVAACASAEEALSTLPAAAPEVVLMDINLPGMAGIDCIRLLKQALPCAQTITIQTVRKHHNNIYRKLQVGNRVEALNKVFPLL